MFLNKYKGGRRNKTKGAWTNANRDLFKIYFQDISKLMPHTCNYKSKIENFKSF